MYISVFEHRSNCVAIRRRGIEAAMSKRTSGRQVFGWMRGFDGYYLGICLLAWLAVVGWPLTSAGEADGSHKRVLILHSVGREFRPWNEYAKDIRAELDRQSRWPVDVQEHSLVPARSGDPRAEALFLDYIRALYTER